MSEAAKINCQNCRINRLCLPVMLAESEIEHLDSIVQRGRPIDKGSQLYHAGDRFKYVYAIRSGSFKSFSVSLDGDQQITGFHLPGELLGLEAISSGTHICFTEALSQAEVCALPYEELESLSAYIPGLRRQLLKIMSQEISDDRELMMLLNQKAADERLAAFLINLAMRYGQRGASVQSFKLPMIRADIANYLGLALETVSRIITRLTKQGLISFQGKRMITIEQLEQLSQLAGVNCHLPLSVSA